MPKVPNDLGNGGARIDTDLKALLNSIIDDVANLRSTVESLVAAVNELKADFNSHTHRYEEGSAAAATQKVTSPPASLAPSASVDPLAPEEQQVVQTPDAAPPEPLNTRPSDY